MKLLFGRASRYIFFELLFGFILGLFVFLVIMVMFQVIHYTEFVLVHGVNLFTVLQMMGYICISFLPTLFPMALLFSTLIAYGRLSQDSEIIGLRAAGYSMWFIALPSFVLGMMVSVFSAQTSFHLAPWGNRQFEILLSHLDQGKSSATIRGGTFSDNLFDLVIYANEVDPKTGLLKKVFIYDERSDEVPFAVIAKRGSLVQENTSANRMLFLRLWDGAIHRQGLTHTKIKYGRFDIRLKNPTQSSLREKSPASLTIEEISNRLDSETLNLEERASLLVEFHRRWAVSIACIIFSILGVAMGTYVQSRRGKNNGLIMSFLIVILYWIVYIAAEGFARSGHAPVPLAIWTPNFIFLSIAFWKIREIWD